MKKRTSYITGNAILIAIEIVLSAISLYLMPKINVEFNIALFPIVVAAIIYGPKSGALLGLVNGILVLTSPGTLATFFQYAPVGTIIVCLFKTTLGGFVAGLLYRIICKKDSIKRKIIGCLIASIIVPLLNTGLFLIGALIFFEEAFIKAGWTNNSVFTFKVVISIVLTTNFIIEEGLCIVLTPVANKIVNIVRK